MQLSGAVAASHGSLGGADLTAAVDAVLWVAVHVAPCSQGPASSCLDAQLTRAFAGAPRAAVRAASADAVRRVTPAPASPAHSLAGPPAAAPPGAELRPAWHALPAAAAAVQPGAPAAAGPAPAWGAGQPASQRSCLPAPEHGCPAAWAPDGGVTGRAAPACCPPTAPAPPAAGCSGGAPERFAGGCTVLAQRRAAAR